MYMEGQEVEAVKRAAQILHYTLAAFVGPSEHEVVILVKIEKANSASSISGSYSEISGSYSAISNPYLTEEEADALCQEGHRLAMTIYQAIIPKPISTDPVSVRSNFHMPLDEAPYFNPKSIALPVSPKPTLADHGDGSPDPSSRGDCDQENRILC